MRIAVQRGGGLALVEPLGDVVQAPLQLLEKHVALFECVFLAALEEVRQHVETLLHAGKDLADIRHFRSVVDFVGDDRDLVGEPLDRLVRHAAAHGQFVDAAGQYLEVLHHLVAGTVLGDFLDLLGERGDTRLDPFERLRVQVLLLRGDGRADDRARNLVEPLLDLGEGIVGAPALLLDEMVESAGERAHLFLERAKRQRFGQIAHCLDDLLHPVGQRGKLGAVGVLAGAGRDAVLEIVETLVEGVPAAIHRAHRLLARQRVEGGLHLLDLQPQHVDASVVGPVAKRLYGARETLQVEAELPRGLAARSVALLEILAQRIEFAAQAGGHLVAQLLAQALQLAGDLAEGGDAVLFLAHPFHVTGDRLVGLVVSAAQLRRAGPDWRARAVEALAIGLGVSAALIVASVSRGFRAVALYPLLQQFERSVELFQGGVGSALPASVDCVEIRPLAVHRNAPFACGWSRTSAVVPPAGPGRAAI